MKTVYLDMDGVLVDFVAGLNAGLGLRYDYNDYPYTFGKYEMFGEAVKRTHGLHDMDSLQRICANPTFWSNLDWDINAKGLLKIVDKYADDVYIASLPMSHSAAWVGKLWWIDKNLPHFKKRLILTTAPKHLLAKPGSILVDDKDENVANFIKAGGEAYLVPQPWNSKWKLYRSDWLDDFGPWMKRACSTT